VTLPHAVTSHHTAWVCAQGQRPHPVRYAVDEDRLVCFGDDGLVDVPDGTRVTVSVHEIAGGQLLAQFGASLRVLTPDAVTTNALVELLEHVPLGRTLEEVQRHLGVQRAERRILGLVP
jgi:hypothetical protein